MARRNSVCHRRNGVAIAGHIRRLAMAGWRILFLQCSNLSVSSGHCHNIGPSDTSGLGNVVLNSFSPAFWGENARGRRKAIHNLTSSQLFYGIGGVLRESWSMMINCSGCGPVIAMTILFLMSTIISVLTSLSLWLAIAISALATYAVFVIATIIFIWLDRILPDSEKIEH